MPRSINRLQPTNNARQSAARFHSRQHQKELRDPTEGLFRTHRIAEGDVDTDTLFDSQGLNPITVAADVLCDASGTVVVKLGSSPATGAGIGFRINGADLTLEAGAGSDDATNNILETLEDAVPIGIQSRIIVAAIPGAGKARAWVNGRVVIRAETDSGSFGDGWI